MLTLMIPAAPNPCRMRARVSSEQRMRKRAKQRCEREQHEPCQVDAAIADDFAERSQRQQRDRDRQLVAVDDPDRKRRARVKVPGDRGQRNIGDGAVHHRHDQAERDREDGPIPLRLRKAIDVLDLGGRHGWLSISCQLQASFRLRFLFTFETALEDEFLKRQAIARMFPDLQRVR